jgi:hypothetical protein
MQEIQSDYALIFLSQAFPVGSMGLASGFLGGTVNVTVSAQPPSRWRFEG